MATFQPGRELCRRFYLEVIAPVIEVPHTAALLGPGSDVLGYDTVRSTDHDWGPRCMIFVNTDKVEPVAAVVHGTLPDTYDGWPLAIGREDTAVKPKVLVGTLPDWAVRRDLCAQRRSSSGLLGTRTVRRPLAEASTVTHLTRPRRIWSAHGTVDAQGVP